MSYWLRAAMTQNGLAGAAFHPSVCHLPSCPLPYTYRVASYRVVSTTYRLASPGHYTIRYIARACIQYCTYHNAYSTIRCTIHESHHSVSTSNPSADCRGTQQEGKFISLFDSEQQSHRSGGEENEGRTVHIHTWTLLDIAGHC